MTGMIIDGADITSLGSNIFFVTNCLFILDDDFVQVCWIRDGDWEDRLLDPLQLELSIEIILKENIIKIFYSYRK